MDSATFIAIVAIILLIIGTTVALIWWKLLRSIAPYKDEVGKGKPANPDADEVVIIPPPSSPSSPRKD